MTHGDMHTETELEVPGLGRLFRLLGRAVRLRCPHCGGGPVLHHWLKLRVRCATCGLRLQRGEHDYFAGSILLAYCLAGVMTLGGVAALVIVKWPAVPWTAIQWAAPAAILVLPFVLFPFSKLLWLAADIAIRPITPRELEWHRAAENEFSTGSKQPR